MTEERPQYVFLHYWGKGKAGELARALKAAMDTQRKTASFGDDAPGALPKGWTQAMTHDGGAPDWKVVTDTSAPSPGHVLAQLSTDATNGRFPLAILDGTSMRDGVVGVRTRAISGKVDRGGGIVWRYRDPNNYYVVRANALENNVVLYKVEKGKRTALAPVGMPKDTYGVKAPVPADKWNALEVDFRGTRFVVTLNGAKLFEVDDATFPDPGKIGLWTKADSVIHFDDFSFKHPS